MALLFCDSFDHYSTITHKWSNVSNGAISSGNGRNGTSSLRFSSVDGTARNTLSASVTTLIAGMAFRLTSGFSVFGTKAIIRFREGSSNHVELQLTTAGELIVSRNGTQLATTSGLNIQNNTWYYIEFKATVHDTTGSFTVKVAGTQVLAATGQDTRNGSTGVIDNFELYGTNGGADFDDLYICDTSGSVNNDFLGDVRVKAVLPDGAGNYSQWTPSAGSNYQCVDESAPNSDTDYNSEASAGEKDSYTYAAVGITGTVKAVQALAFQRKDDAGTRTTRLLARIGGSDYFASNFSALDSYTYDRKVWDQSPATTATWTVAEIDGAEFGIELVS